MCYQTIINLSKYLNSRGWVEVIEFEQIEQKSTCSVVVRKSNMVSKKSELDQSRTKCSKFDGLYYYALLNSLSSKNNLNTSYFEQTNFMFPLLIVFLCLILSTVYFEKW